MGSSVVIAIAASLLVLALFIALTAVLLVLGLLWMRTSRRPRRMILADGDEHTFLFDPHAPVETFVPTGHAMARPPRPSSGYPPRGGSRPSLRPQSFSQPPQVLGFFDDEVGLAADASRTELFRESEVRDFWTDQERDGDGQDVLATEIFSAQAIDFSALGIDELDDPTGRFRR